MPMNVERTTRIAILLRRVPDVEDVLAWYGLEIDPEDNTATIEEIARANRIDPDELVDDLQVTVNESAEEADEDDDYLEDDDDPDSDVEHDLDEDDDDDDEIDEDEIDDDEIDEDDDWGSNEGDADEED